MRRGLGVALLVAGCGPSFDDLRGQAWSDSQGAPDGIAATDFAISVATVDREQPGATLVIAGADPVSLVTASYDDHGVLTRRGLDVEDASFAAAPVVAGALDPVVGGDGVFAVGGLAAPDIILLFDARTGAQGPELRARIDEAACGAGLPPVTALIFALTSLGIAEEPDLIALAGDQLLAIPDVGFDGALTCLRCTLTDAEARPASALDVAAFELDALDGEEIAIAVSDAAGGASRLVVIVATALEATDGATCFASPPLLDGVQGGQGEPDLGTRIAIGDADDSGLVELAMTAPSSDRVYVFPELAALGPGADIEVIPAPAGSRDFGASAVFGDFDGDGGEEIAIGDPAAPPSTVDGAGQVTVYTLLEDGTYEPIAVLHDSTPRPDQGFGRALAVAEFISGGEATDLLVVAARGELFTYFRAVTGGADPRQ